MKRTRAIERIGAVVLVAWCVTTMVRADLQWRVSVKRLFDESGNPPGQGLTCSGIGAAADTVEGIVEKLDYGNVVMDHARSGYRFDYEVLDLVQPPPPPADISGIAECTTVCAGTTWGLTHWSQIEGGGCARCVLDFEARQDPAGFLYDPGAFNIYVTDFCTGGAANPRSSNTAPLSVIYIGQNFAGSPVRFVHELGHALNLCHTHGSGACSGRCSAPSEASTCTGGFGDDCSDDTEPDNSKCVFADDYSSARFGQDYDALADCATRERVLDVMFNVMSYHQDDDGAFWNGLSDPLAFSCPVDDLDLAIACDCDINGYDLECPGVPPRRLCRHRLTPDQVDTMIDRSNALFSMQPGIADGLTHYVDPAGSDSAPGSVSTAPFATVGRAVTAAAANATRDSLRLAGGTYAEALVLTEPLTIRAPRGSAVISAP